MLLPNRSICKRALRIGLSITAITLIFLAGSVAFEPAALQYDLPLTTDQINNYDDFITKAPLSEDAVLILNANGFVVMEDPFVPGEEDITRPYDRLKRLEVPIFITTDSLLHLYHIQFDETLRSVEEDHFYDDLWQISETMLAKSEEDCQSSTGDAKEGARRNMAFFSVGLKLLEPRKDQLCQGGEWECSEYSFEGGYPYFRADDLDRYRFEVPVSVEDEVSRELELIRAHSGFSKSPVFGYNEDYSQYLPRGHYTRPERLKNYFQAMMWYGRMSFLLKGCEGSCIVSEENATVQTIEACMIAQNLANDPDSMERWNKIYNVTSFYVGYSDDLGPYEYNEALNDLFGGTFQARFMSKEDVETLKTVITLYRMPLIYGGTGAGSDACTIDYPNTKEQADQCLAATAGFRLMGQRFVPDSYIFQNLVFPYAGDYTGDYTGQGTAFTQGPFGRHFPRGLDVMALLGSKRATVLLDDLGDSDYSNYEAQRVKLGEEFAAFSEDDWQRNLYWSWLYSLKPLLATYNSGYPTFMQTEAWQDKELTTSLASWTELRHDTILYAKQSYAFVGTGMPTEPKLVPGYVEPVPEFYIRLLSLTKMTNQNLDDMGLLDPETRRRLDRLESTLARLAQISLAELENRALSDEDYRFINEFGDSLESVVTNVDDASKKTTIVADVHTDPNSGLVLEEGVGYVRLMVVAYKVPDGRILLGAGPVFSYYEFKQLMSERLTDESWRAILKVDPPEDPEWAPTFTAGIKIAADDSGAMIEPSHPVEPSVENGGMLTSGIRSVSADSEIAPAPNVPEPEPIAEPQIILNDFYTRDVVRIGWLSGRGWFVDCFANLTNSGDVDGVAMLKLTSSQGTDLGEHEVEVPARKSVTKRIRADVSWKDKKVTCEFTGQKMSA